MTGIMIIKSATNQVINPRAFRWIIRSSFSRNFSQGRKTRLGTKAAKYLQSLKWTPIPLGIGFAYLGYQHFGHVKRREKQKLDRYHPSDELATDLELFLIKVIPLRHISRLAGWFAERELPIWLRRKFFSCYIRKYDCDMSEAVDAEPTNYSTFQKFFGRRLKSELRPVNQTCSVVSPSDGTVLNFGVVKDDMLEQVKGITYSVDEFIGRVSSSDADDRTTTNQLLVNKDNVLYFCTIYLSPGNYHRFHSPTDWHIHQRRHFSGELLSTMPSFVHWIKGLYCINERVACIGTWKHGFFSMIPVGATNVGSIKLYFEPNLSTNCRKRRRCNNRCSYVDEDNKDGVGMVRGQEFGEFKLGSTIVLLFEGPRNLEFKVSPSQIMKYGQSLCDS